MKTIPHLWRQYDDDGRMVSIYALYIVPDSFVPEADSDPIDWVVEAIEIEGSRTNATKEAKPKPE